MLSNLNVNILKRVVREKLRPDNASERLFRVLGYFY